MQSARCTIRRHLLTRGSDRSPTARPPTGNWRTAGRRRKIYIYGTAAVVGATGALLWSQGRPLGGAHRFARSLAVGLAISADYWWTLYGLDETQQEYKRLESEVHVRSADRLVQGCLKNGGLYIKIGQGIGSLNHILPTEYLEALKCLQDRCLTRSADELDQIFTAEFGARPEDLFRKFEREPIAAASLAQVFRAETVDGDPVAVKVQYIDLRDRFPSDLLTLRMITTLVGWLHPKFKFAWILDDIESTLKQELDFVNEARNSERCSRELKHLNYVYVPGVHWDLTNARVLTTEFIEGVKISDKDGLAKQGFSLSDIDRKLISTFSEQIFVTGFVHADPHPGNVLVRKSKDGKAELVLLDHGLYQTVPREVRSSLCDFWRAIVMKDHPDMERCAKRLAVDDYEVFAEILTQRPLNVETFSLRTALSEAELRYMTDMARKRFDKVTATLRAMPPDLIFVIRNLNTVRSITREHGDPVDRLRIMVRSALRNNYGFFALLRFEFIMWGTHLRLMFLRLYLRILTIIGRSPDTSNLLRHMH